jgi:ribosomal-protein-alanine N-acetyltransferase
VGSESLQGILNLRKFAKADLKEVVQINQTCLPENYTDFFFLDLYSRFPEAFIVAEDDGKVVGYIMCRVEIGLSSLGFGGLTKKGHVVSVAVMPQHRRKGMGEALVTRAMQGMQLYGAKQCYLEVRITNQAAVNLYKKLGFQITRTIRGYYADGESAYVMSIKL